MAAATLRPPPPEPITYLATYVVDISGPTSDKLIIGGMLDLTNNLDQITFNGSPDGTSTYVLATYASRTGTFDFGAAPPGYQLIYGTNQLTLAPVPEPNTLALAAIASAMLVLPRTVARSGKTRRH